MKESITYAYNLNVSDLIEIKDYYKFELNTENYYFVPLNRSIEELEDIISCSIELKEKGINCHDIFFNRDKSVITKIGESSYVLLKINGDEKQEYSLNDILEINNRLVLSNAKSKLYRNNWGEMWSSKIDYFEYQIRERGKENAGLLDSFNYYVGMAENAISYVNKTIKNYKPTFLDRVTLSHRRLFYPNVKLNYLNPLSFIFDLEVRDIAEYIKNLFFYGEDAYFELELYLKLRKLSPYGYQMFYARLLYPSYYFDIYEKIMNEGETQDKLIHIINKLDNYELFLKNAYNLILGYSPIEKIEWIANKKEL